jgi:hypothetical protein
MDGAAPTVVVVVAAAAAGAFGFVVFLAAKAPDVETAKIARPTRVIFFMLSSPFSLEKWTRQQSSIKLPSRQAERYAPGHDTFALRKTRRHEPAASLH